MSQSSQINGAAGSKRMDEENDTLEMIALNNRRIQKCDLRGQDSE